MCPKSRPLWKQTSIARALLSISFRVTSKGALPPGSPHSAPTERDAPFLEPPFTHLSMSPVYEPLSRFPSTASMERDARFHSLFYISSRVPSNEVPPPGSPHRAPSDRPSTPRVPFIHPYKSPVNELPSRSSSGAPMERHAHHQSNLWIGPDFIFEHCS